MGRLKDRSELKGKRGPGRKSKKQSDPSLPPLVVEKISKENGLGVKSGRVVGGKIRQRHARKARFLAAVTAMRDESKKKSRRKSKPEAEEIDYTPPEVIGGFSDENRQWLKPILKSPGTKSNKKKRVSISKKTLEADSDGSSSEGVSECSLFLLFN